MGMTAAIIVSERIQNLAGLELATITIQIE